MKRLCKSYKGEDKNYNNLSQFLKTINDNIIPESPINIENTPCKNEVEYKEEKISKYKSEISRYKSEISRCKDEISKYKSEISKYKSEISNYESILNIKK